MPTDIIQPRMFVAIDGFHLVQIGIDDDGAIEVTFRRRPSQAISSDSAQRLVSDARFGRDDTIDRAVVLIILQRHSPSGPSPRGMRA